jgi:nicotinamidase-related amidase
MTRMLTSDPPAETRDDAARLAEALGKPGIHLCVDMQLLFSSAGPWPTPWMERKLSLIAEIASRNADRTIFTRFVPPRKPEEMSGRWRTYYERWREVTRERLDPRLLDLVPPLNDLVPPALVVDKPVYSPFHGWRLPALLRQRRVETVVVTGAETDVCVLATVLGAVDYGLHVVLVKDAVCSSSDVGHDAVLTMLQRRFTAQIEVAETESVLSLWSSQHPRNRSRAAFVTDGAT